MSVPCKANTHTGSSSADDSTLMAICRVGCGYPGAVPPGRRRYRFLYVAIDKFTKWPEVTPVVNITKKLAVAFLKSIVCRFGVPNRIIADNGTQFKSRLFQEYCEDIDIHGTPPQQWTGRESECRDPQGTQDPHL